MGRKIIVIDDSQTVRQHVAGTLKHAGFEAVEAVDGQHGAEVIERNPDAALVICDVNMPKKSGLELLEGLKKSHAKFPPFLMLTTEGQPQLLERAKASGAKGWLVKPVKPELLLSAVRKLVP
jgi:two-component system chemotaxis response regulator CheY